MNIFVLDYNPCKAAQFQCDKHVVKMPFESAQILCSAFSAGIAPYKITHYYHPCSVWTREAKNNYVWLIQHGLALCDEYTDRYGKNHKSREFILWCQKNMRQLKFESEGKTHFVLWFDNKYKVGNAVESYREYYRAKKSQIAKWAKSRLRPKLY
jgi:hypothetical protein